MVGSDFDSEVVDADAAGTPSKHCFCPSAPPPASFEDVSDPSVARLLPSVIGPDATSHTPRYGVGSVGTKVGGCCVLFLEWLGKGKNCRFCWCCCFVVVVVLFVFDGRRTDELHFYQATDDDQKKLNKPREVKRGTK